VRVNFEMEPGTRIDVVERKIAEIESILRREVPELKTSASAWEGAAARSA
jgi:hypothetical protein